MKQILVLLGLALGVYLILQTPSSNDEEQGPSSVALGYTAKSVKELFVRREGQLKDQEVNFRSEIYDLDTWETGSGGSAILQFNSGAVLEMKASSRLIVDYFVKERKVEVTVLQGQVKLVTQVDQNVFELIQSPSGFIDGDTSVSDIHIKLPAETPRPTPIQVVEEQQTPVPAPTAPKTLPPRPKEPKGSLSMDYIDKVIAGQRRFIQRCYIKYFNRNKGQVKLGQVTLGFIIEPSGRVNAANIVNSEIEDKKYQSCLLRVIERARFKSFEAQPIEVEYPIQMALQN